MSQKIINLGILTPYLEGFYFGGLIDGIHSACREHGVRLFVVRTSFKKQPTEKAYYNYRLALNHIDGWIILPQGASDDYMENITQLGKPIYMLNNENKNPHCNYILADNTNCFKEATIHMAKHGHRKIGFVGCFDIVDVHERYEGYLAGLKECGIPLNPKLVYRVSNAIQSGGYEAAYRLMEDKLPCTAIVSSTDSNALGIIFKLQEKGYRIPDDLAIIGCDDINLGKNITPTLSTIHQNLNEITYTAVQSILETIKNKNQAPSVAYTKSHVILRESCGCKDNQKSDLFTNLKDENYKHIQMNDYLGHVLINNFYIGDNLIKTTTDELKCMTWLNYTSFKWACAGLWDKSIKNNELVIKQLYNRTNDKELLSPLDFHSKMEDFPPLEFLPDSTHSGGEDIIWLHLIKTDIRDWGVLALVGPMDKMKLLSNFDTMSNRFDILAFALEREALSENRYRSLLDNVGQGILSFGEDLLIDHEYSKECLNIFGKNIDGQFFPALISPQDEEQRVFIANILSDLMNESNDKKISLFSSLLPSNFIINNRNIHVSYKLIEDFSPKALKKMVLIITDITDRVELEHNIEYERNTLKMVVKAVVCYNELVDLIRDYHHFCKATLKGLLKDSHPVKDSIAEIFRYIHTFKGNFSQLDMVTTVGMLDQLENKVSEMRKSVNHITHEELRSYFQSLNLSNLLDSDLTKLKSILGESFFEMDTKLVISENRIKKIEQVAASALSTNDCKTVLPEIRKLRYKPLKELINYYSDYTLRLSERLKKSIFHIDMKGGEDVFVDPEKYHNFVKSLVHVFRNAVDHGIEFPHERLQKGKIESGTISCSIKSSNDKILITISDDGKGISLQKIREKLMAKGMYDARNASKLTDKELIKFIFDDDFSTREDITELSGRGVGLATVRDEVDKLGGTIEVDTKESKGTTIKFILPNKTITDISDISAKHIAETILHKTKEFFEDKYSFNLVHCSNLYNQENKKIELYDLTSSINIRGLVDGKLVLSMSEKMSRSIVKAFLLEQLSPEKEAALMEDVLAECTNIILGNSMENLKDIEELVLIETPITVNSKGSFIKYFKHDVWICNLKFEQGDLTLGFVTSLDHE